MADSCRPHSTIDFANPQAVPNDVLAQARADFADAIMTTQTLIQNPPPIPHDQIDRIFDRHNIY